ncbi:MAG: hypothetical protein ABSA59_08210 [Terriglobia bacterium]|jgi:hypothetical protein
MAKGTSLNVFFHQDFDGICSAAVFLASVSGTGVGSGLQAQLVPVDYNVKPNWAETDLPKQSAIVDFLYHPAADWWFDHHPSTFVKAEWEASFRSDDRHVWNTRYKSCPGLILDSLRDGVLRTDLKARFREHVIWSDIIDSAEYSSPAQVVQAIEPALRINLSLAADADPPYLVFLVKCMEEKPLDEVARLGEVSRRYEKAMEWQKVAISYMEKVAEVTKGVAFFDLTKRDGLFHRYAPYYFWPQIKFVVAVYANGQAFRITVSSNPWGTHGGPDLGALCEQYGGGGHRRVGGVANLEKRQALRVGREMARKLRGEEPYTEQLPFRQELLREHR